MPLVELHEEDPKRKSEPVFVNSSFVTFIQKSPTSPGTIVGLVGDDLGCVVRESVRDVAMMVMDAEGVAKITPQSADKIETDWIQRYVRTKVENVENADKQKEPKSEETVAEEKPETHKARKARKWHSRKPFSKEGEV